MMKLLCERMSRQEYRIVKLGIFSPVTGFVTKGPAFVWEGPMSRGEFGRFWNIVISAFV